MTPTRLDLTLEKYLKRQLSSDESSRVELWLRTMMKNRYYGDEIGRYDEEKLNGMILNNRCQTHEIIQFHPKFSDHSSIEISTPLIVSTVVIVLGVFLFLHLVAHSGLAGRVIPNHHIDKVFFQDGTIGVLSTESYAAYAESDNGRHVIFSGEGLFEVSKSNASLFIVKTENLILSISGTCYVKASVLGFNVQVLDGAVDVCSNSGRYFARAMKGQSVQMNADGSLKILATSLLDIPKSYLTEYLVKFDQAAFLNVISKIQSKFGVKIYSADSFKYQSITGDFTGKSLVETLESLAAQLHLQYTIEGDAVKLSDAVGNAQIE